MPLQQLFEGPDVAKLLARIQEVAGPHARIISADKVRKGGMGGFFARETYEIVVETPDAAPAGGAAGGVTGAAAGGAAPVGTSVAELTAAALPPRPVPVPAKKAAGWMSMAMGMRAKGAETVPVAANNKSFEAVLASLIQTSEPAGGSSPEAGAGTDLDLLAGSALEAETGLESDAQVAGAVPQGTASAVTAPAATAGAVSPNAAIPNAGSPAPVGARSGGLSLVDDDDDLSDLLALAVVPEPALPALRAPARGTTPGAGGENGEFATAEEWLSEKAPLRATNASAVRPRGAAGRTRSGSGRAAGNRRPAAIPPARLRSALKGLGVPTSLIPADSRRGLVNALARSLADLPEAPPADLEAGDVLAVIGCPQRAPRLAARVAMTLGLDPAALPAASVGEQAALEASAGATITSAEAARSMVNRWAHRPEPTVIWIDAPVGSGREAWARRVIEAIEPVAVWGVVEAMRKPEDIKAWASAVGGLDALAVEDLDATSSPAAVLSTGVPVVLADGKRATPEVWAAVLADRLSELAA